VGNWTWRCSVSGWGKIRAGAGWRLSQALATHWNWRQRSGAVEGHGGAHVPAQVAPARPHCPAARRQIPTNRMRVVLGKGRTWNGPAPHRVQFGSVRSVDRREVSSQAAERAWVKAALFQFHYLGFGGAIGENLQYVVRTARVAPWPVWCLELRLGSARTETGLSVVGPTAATPSGPHRQQYPLSYSTMGQGASFGQLDIGPSQPPARPRLAGQVWAWHRAAGDFVERERFRGTAYRAATGWRWARRLGAPGRTGTPAFKRPSKTFISIRCDATFGRHSKHEEPRGVAAGSLPAIQPDLSNIPANSMMSS